MYSRFKCKSEFIKVLQKLPFLLSFWIFACPKFPSPCWSYGPDPQTLNTLSTLRPWYLSRVSPRLLELTKGSMNLSCLLVCFTLEAWEKESSAEWAQSVKALLARMSSWGRVPPEPWRMEEGLTAEVSTLGEEDKQGCRETWLWGVNSPPPWSWGASLVAQCKESTCQYRRHGFDPGWGRFPGEGNGIPTPMFLPGNPMDRGAWWAMVHGVTKESDTTERLNNNPWTQVR